MTTVKARHDRSATLNGRAAIESHLAAVNHQAAVIRQVDWEPYLTGIRAAPVPAARRSASRG